MEQHQPCETSELQVTTTEPEANDLNEAWNEVGAQFQQLGSRLAAAFQRSWSATGNAGTANHTMQNLRDNLRLAADRVDQAIRDSSEATREDRINTIRVTRRASEQSLEEARLLTAATLRKLNRQLDHLVEHMDSDDISNDR